MVLVAIAAGGWWWLTGRSSRHGAIVLISIDTVRADRLPLYGYAKGQTPALNAFAKDAVLFERAYAHAPQTLPSHTSILTGLLPFEHGVRDNLGFVLAKDKVTLASLLGEAGYTTAGFVSAYVLRPETDVGLGFATYNAEFPAGSQERSVAQVRRPGSDTLAAAEAWLKTLGNDRFFLFFHIYEPHKPYTPPSKYAALDPYDGEIAFSDEIVGTLIDDLKRRGWYDDATIVVLSDHGEGLGDHGEEEHGLFVYDSTVHVPLLIKLPGNPGGGRRIADPVQHIDLFPTLASIASVHAPANLRGRNLLPALLRRRTIEPQGIYAEALYGRYHFGWSELLSLTDERFRFIKAPRSELYDLERDPTEHANAIAERPQVASAMRSGLDALVAGRPIDAPAAGSAEDRARLAALGYIGAVSPVPASQSGATLADPKDKAALLSAYREAIDAAGTGRLGEAADGFRKIVAQEPAMTDAWSQYGTVLLHLGRLQDALAAFQVVIRQEPNEPPGPINAATVLLKLGRFDEARAHAQLAARLVPAAAHELLAKIALAQKDADGALREAALAERADPTLPMPDYVQGLIQHEQQHYAQALPSFMRAYDRVNNRTMQIPELRYYIADCLARLDRPQEAERFFREEIAIYSFNVRARTGLAMLYEAAGQTQNAERAIDQMLHEVPTPDAYSLAAQLWRTFGYPDREAAVLAASRAKFGKPGK